MFSAEFDLLVTCCRLAFHHPARGPTGHDFDWQRFFALCRRHRVQGLGYAGVESMGLALPTEVAGALKDDARAIAEHNLRIVAESARLLKTFRRSGVAILFLKGVTLGALAYRDPYLKMGWDLDILVSKDRAGKAARLLLALGYDLLIPRRRSAFRNWHKRRKESVWRHRQSGIHVELHTRLADNPALIAELGIRSPGEEVSIDGVLLPTLNRTHLFSYLCVHGASSAWFRLKWASDLAGLLSSCSADDVESLYLQSQELGAGRAAGQALLLINRLFATPLSNDLERELRSSRPTRWLTDAAFREMRKEREPTERLLGTAAIHWSQLLLLPGIRYAASEGFRQIGDSIRRP